MFELHGKYTNAVIQADRLDSNCVSQIQGMINHVAFDQPVVIMPDAHAGKGAVIGFTMPLGSKLVPNIIGVDIGCGMTFARLGTGKLENFAEIDREIRREVPFGVMIHDERTIDKLPEYGFWARAQHAWDTFAHSYKERFGDVMLMPAYDKEWFDATLERIGCPPARAANSIGTLGGGNHFIEFALDESGDTWLVIHSGSRKFGECVCKYWQRRAIRYQEKTQKSDVTDEINRLKAEKQTFAIAKRVAEIKAARPQQVRGLEWLETLKDRLGYMHDMLFAQQYASFNRFYMFDRITGILGVGPSSVVRECVHNFIDPTDMVIRKGAINASKNATCLIPFNMAAGSVVGVGKGNPEWNYSAPHGAGRAMSRSKARAQLRLDDFREHMRSAGVWSSSICRSTIDEAPDAYKPVEPLLDIIGETMSISARLKPVLNLKAK